MKVVCPKCGSEQINSDKKGFSPVKGVIGAIAGGLIIGAIAGGYGRNKVILTCLNCGHQFKPGEGGEKKEVNRVQFEADYTPAPKKLLYKCHNCGKETRSTIKCNHCGCILFPSDKIL